MFNHLQAAFRQRLGVADQGECPLVLDLGLIVVDGVGGFHFEDSGFAGEGFDEDLHTSAETKNESAFLVLDLGLDVVSDEYSIQICYNCTIASIHDRPQAAENNNGLEPHYGDAKLERTNEFQKQQSKKNRTYQA